jgi:hypothetical protein
MSLVDIYNKTKKPRVEAAKAIPNQAVNFIDTNNEFQEQWKNGVKRGDPTSFTEKAQKFYNEELKNMIIPDSFVRTDPDVPLNRWSPDKGYNAPGRPGT